MPPDATAAKSTREGQRDVESADIAEHGSDAASNDAVTTNGNPY